MKRTILLLLAVATPLAAGCVQTHMTRVDYRNIKLDVGGRVVPADKVAVIDFQPDVYYMLDLPARQIIIEAKILETSGDQHFREIGIWWPGLREGPLWPVSVVDTTPRAKPMNINVGFGTSLGRGRESRQSNHPPGCTCSQCRGGGGEGGVGLPTLGIGTGVPVGGKEPNGVTSVRSTFELPAGSDSLNEAYIYVLLGMGRELSGRVIAQPLLLPIQTVNDPQAPELKQRQAATAVRVADGGTIVLGGLFNDNVKEAQSKVPALTDIPLLGRLFRNDASKERRTELLIFVTPRIIVMEEE